MIKLKPSEYAHVSVTLDHGQSTVSVSGTVTWDCQLWVWVGLWPESVNCECEWECDLRLSTVSVSEIVNNVERLTGADSTSPRHASASHNWHTEPATLWGECQVSTLWGECQVLTLWGECQVSSLWGECQVLTLWGECQVSTLWGECHVSTKSSSTKNC